MLPMTRSSQQTYFFHSFHRHTDRQRDWFRQARCNQQVHGHLVWVKPRLRQPILELESKMLFHMHLYRPLLSNYWSHLWAAGTDAPWCSRRLHLVGKRTSIQRRWLAIQWIRCDSCPYWKGKSTDSKLPSTSGKLYSNLRIVGTEFLRKIRSGAVPSYARRINFDDVISPCCHRGYH